MHFYVTHRGQTVDPFISQKWNFPSGISLKNVNESAVSEFTERILKDAHREKTASNQTPALTKSVNMDIWVVGTSNQLLIRGS